MTRAERRREEAPGSHAGLPVDLRVEAWIGVRVVDPDRTAVAHDRAGDAVLDRHAHADQARSRVGVLLGDVRKDELVRGRIEEEHRAALRVEDVATLADHERDELLELDPPGERARELVEELEPLGRRRGHDGGLVLHCGAACRRRRFADVHGRAVWCRCIPSASVGEGWSRPRRSRWHAAKADGPSRSSTAGGSSRRRSRVRGI